MTYRLHHIEGILARRMINLYMHLQLYEPGIFDSPNLPWASEP